MNAVLMVETGLTYSPTDPDLLQKKDTFYFSVEPERLTALRDKVKGYFDSSYCITKAMSVLNAKSDEPGLIEWATHLATLARIMQPNGNGVRLVEARCMLRQGQREEGIRAMEAIRAAGKGSGDDLDAWYAATKILGQLYLEELDRPQEALKAFLDYKEYSKSGADTLYYVAKSYEALNDPTNAARFYEAVTAYESHPRLWDAKEALKRLKGK
jgi:tetratricopeptide (TPR) repeat protein